MSGKRAEKRVGVKINFTAESIGKLSGSLKRYNRFDSKTPGLGIAVQPTGAKSFFFLSKVHNYPYRKFIGSADSMRVDRARAIAAEWGSTLGTWKANGSIGPNPLEAPVQVRYTLSEVINAYLAKHIDLQAKNPPAARHNIEVQVAANFKSWMARPVASITREDVKAFHERKGATSQSMANRMVELLRRLFTFAMKSDMMPATTNPASFDRYVFKKFRETPRDRFLSVEELKRLFAALQDKRTSGDLRDFVLISLQTGVRRSDLQRMQWKELDLERAVWRVTAETKNGTPFTIPLLPELVAILRKRSKASDYVFPAFNAYYAAIERPFRQLMERAKIEDATLHTLRHTAGSYMAASNVSLHTIGRALGHRSQAATQIYATVQVDAIRDAITKASSAMKGRLLQN